MMKVTEVKCWRFCRKEQTVNTLRLFFLFVVFVNENIEVKQMQIIYEPPIGIYKMYIHTIIIISRNGKRFELNKILNEKIKKKNVDVFIALEYIYTYKYKTFLRINCYNSIETPTAKIIYLYADGKNKSSHLFAVRTV